MPVPAIDVCFLVPSFSFLDVADMLFFLPSSQKEKIYVFDLDKGTKISLQVLEYSTHAPTYVCVCVYI
jgi:hypothetical protein